MQVMLPDTELSPFVLLPPESSGKEYFERLCAANPDLRLERTAQGEILIMPPTGGETGYQNGEIMTQLGNWAKRNGKGVAFDSSAGFELPNGAYRSPDASWVERSRLAQLSKEEKHSFLPLCPDFVIELRSSSDRRKAMERKMAEWISQGAQLAWLIDPEAQSVSIYRPQLPVETRSGILSVEGEGVMTGFTLELEDIWTGL